MDIDDEDYWVFGWQDYDDILERDEEGNLYNLPDWYTFYDTYMDTGGLMLLPDIRGGKEGRYISTSRIKERAEIDTRVKNAPPFVPLKQNLYYNVPKFYEMACEFEDEHFLELLKARLDKQEREKKIDSEEGDVDEYIRLMKEIPDLPAVRGGLNWRAAIRRCYYDHVNRMIAKDLPNVWEEYQLYRSTGLQMAPADNHTDKHRNSMLKMFEDWILDGRELLGEPRDFNF